MLSQWGRIFVLLPRGKICRGRSRRTGARRGTQGWRAAPRLALFLPRWQTVDAGREAGGALQKASGGNDENSRCGIRRTRGFGLGNRGFLPYALPEKRG